MNSDEPHSLFLDEEDEPAAPLPPHEAPAARRPGPPRDVDPPQDAEPSEPPAAPGSDEPPEGSDVSPPPDAPARRATVAELLTALQRIERDIGQIRSRLDATAREERHRDFSLARLVGSAVQALMIGLLLWIVSDWIFGEPRDVLTLKLAFAAVLQLVALTAFFMSREKRP